MSDYVATKGGTGPVLIRGRAKFAKLTNLDQWGKWSCTIFPDQESMPKVHKLISEGVKNKLRQEENGDGYCITFSRPGKIKTKTKGEVDMDPVIVEDSEGHIMSSPYVEDGSDITMKLETYGGRSGSGFGTYKAARLQAIKIHGMKADRPIPF